MSDDLFVVFSLSRVMVTRTTSTFPPLPPLWVRRGRSCRSRRLPRADYHMPPGRAGLRNRHQRTSYRFRHSERRQQCTTHVRGCRTWGSPRLYRPTCQASVPVPRLVASLPRRHRTLVAALMPRRIQACSVLSASCATIAAVTASAVAGSRRQSYESSGTTPAWQTWGLGGTAGILGCGSRA